MKIAMFSDTYFPQKNGVVTSVFNFSKKLSERGHDIHVFVPTRDEDGRSEAAGIKVHESPSVPFYRYPGFEIGAPMPTKKTFKTFTNVDFDIIHSHSMFSAGMQGYFMSKAFRKPLIGSLHTLFSKYTKYLTERFEDNAKKLTWMSKRWYYDKRCDVVTVPTRSTKDLLRERGFKNKVYVLPNGIEVDIQKDIDPETIRERHSIGEEEDVILYLGRLSVEKRVEDLIKAVDYMERDVKLLICGSGPYEDDLKELAEGKETDIIFPGYIPENEKGSYYSAADLFAFPSIGDTHGIVLLEALKYGLPVVSVEAQGVVDIVKDLGDNLLAKPKSPKDLASKMERVLSNQELRNDISEKGRDVVERHSWPKVTNKLENIYKEVLRHDY